MIRLTDKETGAALGSISEEQFRFLMENLEEESPEDDDYYLNGATLELLEDEGADPALIKILRDALGEREEMELRWVRS